MFKAPGSLSDVAKKRLFSRLTFNERDQIHVMMHRALYTKNNPE